MQRCSVFGIPSASQSRAGGAPRTRARKIIGMEELEALRPYFEPMDIDEAPHVDCALRDTGQTGEVKGIDQPVRIAPDPVCIEEIRSRRY